MVKGQVYSHNVLLFRNGISRLLFKIGACWLFLYVLLTGLVVVENLVKEKGFLLFLGHYYALRLALCQNNWVSTVFGAG